MAAYSSGSVKVKVGSSEVVGSSTVFTGGNVVVGDLFKIDGEPTFWEVAAINSATNLTLSGRYANTSYETARSESLASVTTATKLYSGTLTYKPVMQDDLVINASVEKFTDNGAGVLSGDGSPAGSGTIDYDTGAWTVTLGTDITATANMTASYNSGDTRGSQPYQIVSNYTSNYSFPEAGLNDVDLAIIYTKSMRLVDSAIYNASVHHVTSASDLEVTASANGLIQASPDGTRWRLRVDNSGNVTATKV